MLIRYLELLDELQRNQSDLHRLDENSILRPSTPDLALTITPTLTITLMFLSPRCPRHGRWLAKVGQGSELFERQQQQLLGSRIQFPGGWGG